MNIVIDQSINSAATSFPAGVRLVRLATEAINAQAVREADGLFITTRTRVDQALVQGSRLKFIASAASGEDHLDTEWLKSQGIQWASARGANAMACAQYVLATVAALQAMNKLAQGALRVGVIGVGAVGSLVVKHFECLGFEVLVSDPPRSEQEPNFYSTPLDEWRDLDCVCVHVPLTQKELANQPYPTYHLINDAFLRQQKSGCVILNAARGEVIDEQALLANPHCHYCLDVWAKEPDINRAVLDRALLATPHIAGYSQQAKQNAFIQVFNQASRFFAWSECQNIQAPLQTELSIALHANNSWQQQVLACYDPSVDDQAMRQAFNQNPSNTAATFSTLRKNYRLRQEF